jgi:multidrug efflux pump subunit AcrA (membrane-fusion protein)
MRSTLIRLIILLSVAAVAGMGYYLVKRIPERKVEVPVVQVKRGDLIIRSFVRGELRAVRSATLTTPNLGATTQVTRLAPAGALAQAKDLVVEFDDSELVASLEDAELEVAQVSENIKKAEADQASRRNQDQVDLLKARYAVRRAELEVKRNELISRIDARKNELTLEEAKRALAKLEEDVKSRLQQGEAELAVLREQRRKALLEVNRVKTRMAQTRLLAPITGLVAIKENRSGGFNFGQQAPEIREGDQLSPGNPIAEILDLSELEVSARVNELERASLKEGQEVLVRLDALPGKVVHGKIKALSGTASSNVFSSDPAKKFDCTFSINMREMLAHVGATPQQIDRVMATAAENAKSFATAMAAPSAPSFGGGGPGGEGRGRRGGGGENAAGLGPRQEGGPSAEGQGGRRRGEGGGQFAGGTAGGVSDEQRQKMREAFQKALGGRDIQSMSQEERQKFFAEMREKMGGAMPFGGGGGGGFGRRGGGEGGAGGGLGPGGQVRFGPAVPGGPGPGGPGMMVAGGPEGPPDLASLSLRQGASQQFSAADREKAQLPAAPEEGSVMDVLLRPGLLVEAEIIVQKIPNTLYVPMQAVFDKGGRTVVFVRNAERFEMRPVKLGGRTESQVTVLEGLREGDSIALQDMEAGPAQPSKKSKDKEKGKSSQPALPAGPKAQLGLPAGGRVG